MKERRGLAALTIGLLLSLVVFEKPIWAQDPEIDEEPTPETAESAAGLNVMNAVTWNLCDSNVDFRQ